MTEHPYKSTTHDERFFHVALAAQVIPCVRHAVSHFTVFARYEPKGPPNQQQVRPEGPGWYASVAYCDARGMFSREVGRKTARRKYFLRKRWPVGALKDAEKGVTFHDAAIFPLQLRTHHYL